MRSFELRSLAGVTLELEPFRAIWPEVGKLGEAHFAEVDGGVEPKRKFKLDLVLMNAMSDAGVLRIVVARDLGKRILGYFTWQISPDVESQGLLVAQQGAWYVSPGHPRIALALFQRSLLELRALGVDCVFPHHRLQGRGAGLERFFIRQGAKAMQVTYSLWIGDLDA